MSYTTMALVKGYLGIDTSITTDDTRISSFATTAQQIIDQACGRSFEASADATRHYHALDDVSADGLTLFLDADLCQITSVVNGDGVTISPSAYVTQPVNIGPWYALKLKISGSVIWTYSNDPEAAIAVTGRWAWSVTAPDDVRWAALRLSAWLYEQRSNFDKLMSAFSTSSGSLKIPTGLPEDVVEVLTRYQRRLT